MPVMYKEVNGQIEEKFFQPIDIRDGITDGYSAVHPVKGPAPAEPSPIVKVEVAAETVDPVVVPAAPAADGKKGNGKKASDSNDSIAGA